MVQQDINTPFSFRQEKEGKLLNVSLYVDDWIFTGNNEDVYLSQAVNEGV